MLFSRLLTLHTNPVIGPRIVTLAALDAATILGAKQVLGIHNNNWLVHFMLYIMIRHISRYVHRH